MSEVTWSGPGTVRGLPFGQFCSCYAIVSIIEAYSFKYLVICSLSVCISILPVAMKTAREREFQNVL